MIDRESPVTEEELHAYVDGELAADRRAAVEQWLAAPCGGCGARRGLARAGRRDPRALRRGRATSRCRRVSISRCWRAASRRWSRARGRRGARGVPARRRRAAGTGAASCEGAGPTRSVTVEAIEAHRLYIAEVRHPIEVKAGESHLNPLALAPRRLRDADAQSRSVRAEAARRAAAAGQRRPSGRALYV